MVNEYNTPRKTFLSSGCDAFDMTGLYKGGVCCVVFVALPSSILVQTSLSVFHFGAPFNRSECNSYPRSLPSQRRMATPSQSAKRSSGGDLLATRWGRTGDPGSAFNGLDKPARGRKNGRARGGRRGIAKSSPPHSVHSASPIQKSNSLSGTSQVTTSPPSPATTKTGKTSTSSLKISNPQALTQISPSVPPVLFHPVETTAKSHNRRSRSNAPKNIASQPSSGIDSRTRKHRPPELSSPPPAIHLTPIHVVNTPSTPNSSSDVKANIDALVERVRASAMANHRPGTPGSHIDWADDDDSLPDLNDWGIKSPAPPTSQAMISPILVDGLTPLPESASLPESHKNSGESIDVTERVDARKDQNMAGVADNSHQPATDRGFSSSTELPEGQATQAHLHPSLPPKPMQHQERHPPRPRTYTNNKRINPPMNGAVLSKNAPVSAALKNPTTNQTQVQNQETRKEELGLSASIHAPLEQEANRSNDPNGTALQPSVPIRTNSTHHSTLDKSRAREITHSRAHTVGQPLSVNRRVHPTTVSDGTLHARSQSSPTAAKNNGRSLHRPVLTGDAMAKLAKTIGGTTTSRSVPLSTSTE